MRIIDARSGYDLQPGSTVAYKDDSQPYGAYVWKLVDVQKLSWRVARFTVEIKGRIHFVDGPIRYLHPKYLFQQVAFVPT